MPSTKWVLIDESNGAACGNGETITPLALARIAEACTMQMTTDYAPEYGGNVSVRVGSGPGDIQPGESAYVFTAELPNAPGASAYHDVDGNGVPFAFCAVTTCGSLFGPDGASVDASHEIVEAERDKGCNQTADDHEGQVHACEACDPVEVQTYPKTCADGTVVQVSNFILDSWLDPGGQAPYDFMSKAGLEGAVAPPGPMQIAPSPGGNGNYQIVGPSTATQETQVFGAKTHKIVGTPKKPDKVAHWSSRLSRRMHGAA